jgi:hypothetical protein
VLLRPRPYAEPERLLSIATYFPSLNLETLLSADYAQFGRESHIFESMAAYPHQSQVLNLTTSNGPSERSEPA